MMNERIRELAEQVGAVRNVLAMGRHDGVLFTEFELEKFAELIVRECAGLVEDHYDDGDNNSLAGHKIRKHFGVK
jgi:hypothetical protein